MNFGFSEEQEFLRTTAREFLAKESVFRVPLVGPILYACKQIPVRRGTADAGKALDAAIQAVNSGGCVVIYPEGTTTKEPNLWPMRGKTGAARLALATGAPVIPIGQFGMERIFDPRTKKLRVWRTPVHVWAGPPIDLSKWAGQEPTAPVQAEMTDEIIPIYAMSPGMRNSALRSSGLYQTRDSTEIGGPDGRLVARSWY